MDSELNMDLQSLAAKIGAELKKFGLTVSTAESCTGGGIAALLTEIPGSSEWFVGGFVTYSNEWKMKQLGVKAETLEKHGAVSEETVGEMLEGLLRNGGADYGIAVSGIAGPGGGTPEKPVGTVYVGIANQSIKCSLQKKCDNPLSEGAVAIREEIRRCQFSGGRSDVRRATAETALKMLWNELIG